MADCPAWMLEPLDQLEPGQKPAWLPGSARELVSDREKAGQLLWLVLQTCAIPELSGLCLPSGEVVRRRGAKPGSFFCILAAFFEMSRAVLANLLSDPRFAGLPEREARERLALDYVRASCRHAGTSPDEARWLVFQSCIDRVLQLPAVAGPLQRACRKRHPLEADELKARCHESLLEFAARERDRLRRLPVWSAGPEIARPLRAPWFARRFEWVRLEGFQEHAQARPKLQREVQDSGHRPLAAAELQAVAEWTRRASRSDREIAYFLQEEREGAEEQEALFERAVLRAALQQQVASMPGLERDALLAKAAGRTQAQVAKRWGVTQGAVSQARKRALKKILQLRG